MFYFLLVNNIITFVIISLLLHSSIRQRSLGKLLPQQVSSCSRLLTYISKHYVVQFGNLPKYTIVVVGYSSSRKEVFQPHLPVRLPCYDLAPVTSFTLGRSLRSRTLGTPSFHGLTGGVYKARERIHRAMADARLLANPTSWRRVSASNPN